MSQMTLKDLNLSTRSYNCLRRAEINTIQELLDVYNQGKLICVRNIGQKGYDEVVSALRRYTNTEDPSNLSDEYEEPNTASDSTDSDVPSELENISIRALDIPARLFYALLRGNYDTIGKLLRMTNEDVLSLRSIGAKSLADFQRLINNIKKQYGFDSVQEKESDNDREHRVIDIRAIDTVTVKLLINNYGLKFVWLTDWYNTNKQRIQRLLELSHNPGNWLNRQLLDTDKELIHELINRKEEVVQNASYTWAYFLNNRENDCAIVIVSSEEIKCFFLNDLPIDLQEEIKKQRLDYLSFDELALLEKGKKITLLKQDYFIPGDVGKFNKLALGRRMSLEDYSLFISGMHYGADAYMTDEKLIEFLKTYYSNGQLIIPENNSTRWFRLFLQRKGLDVNDVADLFGFVNQQSPGSRALRRIRKEFEKKTLLGDIKINDGEFELLTNHLRSKYDYMIRSGQHTINDPILCIALIQIGVRYYDGAFWPHVANILGELKSYGNYQWWLGTSFLDTMKEHKKLLVSASDRVDSMLMHGFVSDAFAEKFFDFLYAFYKIDLDRDINRLDKDSLNDLIETIQRNDNSGRTYNLVEHTADAVRQNTRGAKTRIRRYLRLIDKAFWGDDLPDSSSNRLMQRFLTWKESSAEFVQEKRRRGEGGKRGKRSFVSPYLKYDGRNDVFCIILPGQIIRTDDCSNLWWIVESEHNSSQIEINPYAGVTGYKTEQSKLDIVKEELFDGFKILLVNGNGKIRSFRIPKEAVRFFDEDGDYVRNDLLQQGIVYSFAPSGFRPESEAICDEYDDGSLISTKYDFVNGDIIRIPDGKPLSVGGKLREGLLPRGVVEGVIAGNLRESKCVYRTIPSILVKMLPSRMAGTAIRINGSSHRFLNDSILADGISEFELMDRTGENGYLIDLSKFGCVSDGAYNVFVDVPNDRAERDYSFVLIANLDYCFDEAPYIFKTRGTLSLPQNALFKNKNAEQVDITDRKRINFDIIPGEGWLYLDYKGIDIGFEIPALCYKFKGEEWQIGPHIDVWHTNFEPRLFVSYNAERITVLLDDNGEDDEQFATFEKNKSKGLFDCELNRFKSWFGREKDYRQLFISLPGVQEPIRLCNIITQSVFNSGVLKADYNNHKLLGEFDITGFSEYYVDIEKDGITIAEKVKLNDKRLEMQSELKTGIYKIIVFEAEEDEFGFGDSKYYEIGTVKTELLNAEDLSGMNIEITRIHSVHDSTGYLPLSSPYSVVDLKPLRVYEGQNNVYKGKMIVGGSKMVIATFPVSVEFFNLDHLQQVYITFIEDDESYELLYDEYKRIIVKQEDKSISKSQAYRRYKYSLFPEDFVYDIKFIERPVNADVEIKDDRYNNLSRDNRMKQLMSTSIFGD